MTGRRAAFQAVCAAMRGRGFVHDTLERLRGPELAGREAALATDLGLGTIRQHITLERVLGRVAKYEPRRVGVELRAILAIGAYQIISMSRIPEFAAVDESVELARQATNKRGAGMVNAILRNLVRALEARVTTWERLDPRQLRTDWNQACAFKFDVLPKPDSKRNTLAYLAAAVGERVGRFETLVERYGAERAEAAAWALRAVPVTVLHRNERDIESDRFQQRVQVEWSERAEWTPDGVFVPADVNVIDTPLFSAGLAFVQDMTARAAALLLDARRGERILDLCAAPGGKSIVLAQQMSDCGEILACDASPERVERIAENVRRMSLKCIRPHLIQAEKHVGGGAATGSNAAVFPDAKLNCEFDAAIVDVPCSNTGVIARRPEARLGFTKEKLESLVALQAALLRRAAEAVRRGGRLVYSTCSIEPEENEQIVAAFLAERPEWHLLLERTTLPEWGPKLREWRDGGYAALLVKVGEN